MYMHLAKLVKDKIAVTTTKIKMVVVLFGIKYLSPVFNKNGINVDFSGKCKLKMPYKMTGIHYVDHHTSMNHKQCFSPGIPSPFHFKFISSNQFQIKIHIDTQGFENILSDWLAAQSSQGN